MPLSSRQQYVRNGGIVASHKSEEYMSSIKYLIALMLFSGIMLVGCIANKAGSDQITGSSNQSAPAKTSNAEKDLVCNMDVDPADPGTLKTEYKGTTYYFCSPSCKESFEKNPEKYIQAKSVSDGHDMHAHE
jgi:YHS domain-containing protein